MKDLRGILIGFGTMGQLHFDRYRTLGVAFDFVVEPNAAQQERARSLGMTVVEHLESVPANTPVDFFDICSPSFLHARHIELAMAWQKAIFVEKPVVISVADAERLRRLRYAHPIFVGEVEQYNQSLAGFRADGRPYTHIAITRSVNLNFFLRGSDGWFLDEERSGGIVFDLMIHDLTLLVAKYGMPDVVSATSAATRYPCADLVTANLDFGTHTATVTADWTAMDNDHPIRLDIVCTTKDGAQQQYSGGTYGVGTAESDHRDSYLAELAVFLNTVRTGRAPYPLAVYLDAVVLAANIRACLQTG